MSKPADFDNFIKVKDETEESVDSSSQFDQNSDNISKFMDVDHYEEPRGYGFVDAMHAIMKENIEEDRRIVEAREKIGMLVNKIFYNRRHVGEIVDYDAERKWFKVVYPDGACEFIGKDIIDRLAVIDAPMEVDPSYAELKVQEEKEAVRGKRGQTSAENQKPRREEKEGPMVAKKPKASGKKRGRPAKQPPTSPYAPLYTEKKKDAYYWY